MEKMLIGKIVKAQGIKGEVKVASSLDDANAYKRIKYLYINSQRTAVKSIRYRDGFAYILFSTITDRNQAEALRGMEVSADREELILSSGKYFIDDIIGMEIMLDDGNKIGRVEEIMKGANAADVYIINTGAKRILFPFIKELKADVDIERNTITLNAEKFAEVSVDEA